jgi:outer membrane protein OmpA-like peptidoglycan-associated protein
VGLAGASYSPTESSTVHAQWVQNSLAGLPAGSLTFVNTYQVSPLITVTSTFSTAGSTVSLTVPAGSLPSGTAVTYWLLSDAAEQAAPIPGRNTYVLSIVISWLNTDGTVPDTASGKPLVMTITNSEIKAGASVYSVVGNSVTLLGVATQDGQVTVNLTSDPQIYVVQRLPDAPTNTATGSLSIVSNQIVKIANHLRETGPTVGGNTLKINGNFPVIGDCRVVNIDVAGVRLGLNDWSLTSTTLSILMPPNNPGLASVQIYNGCLPLLPTFDYLYSEAVPSAAGSVTKPSAEDVPVQKPTEAVTPKPSASMKKIAMYNFASGAISLTKAQIAELTNLAKTINSSSSKTVYVYGFADSTPSINNSAISKKRASAVEAILSKLLKGKTLRINWFGSSKPLVPGNSPKDNAKNRRVEIWTK